MLLDSPGDMGGPRRYRGDNSPSDFVSQRLTHDEIFPQIRLLGGGFGLHLTMYPARDSGTTFTIKGLRTGC
jgi:hypothetical protein